MQRTLACLAIFAAATAATSMAKADSCDSILTSGLRNITVTYSAEAAIARTYYHNYNKDFKSMSDDQLARAEAEIFGSGKGNAGYQRSQRETDLKVWLETNKTTAESAKSQSASSDLIYQGSVQAWSECNALRAKAGVEINPVISPDNRTVVLSVRYTGFSKSGVKFYGVKAEDFVCTLNAPSDQLDQGIEITQQAIAVHCVRSALKTVTIDGQQFQQLPRGTIAVKTAANPFLLSFEKETTPTLPKAAEEKLSAQIKQLAAKISSLEAALASRTAELQARINGIDKSARDANQVLKNDYEQNAVKYDKTFKIYSSWGLDTNRCLSMNGDIAAVQNFPCSVGNVAADQGRAHWRITKP